MGRVVPWILTALGGFLVWILMLNLREKDYYEGGSPTPVAGDPASDPAFHALIPSELKHSCPACGECVHPVEVVANRRTLTLRDRDGWYRLFWAGDEIYHFEELQQLAACYENRTAEAPEGTWMLQYRAGPAVHPKAAPHDCGSLPPDSIRIYRLRVDEIRAGEQHPSRPGLVYPYSGNKLPPLLHFGWELSATSDLPSSPCPCGEP